MAMPYNLLPGGGLVALPELLERATGRRVHPAVYTLEPQGARLVVVLDPPPERLGAIVVPDDIQQKEPMGSGIVAAVGALVGKPTGHPGAPMCEPAALLYRHIYFGMWAGKFVALPYLGLDVDREISSSPVVLLTDRDVHFIEWYPPSVHIVEPSATTTSNHDDTVVN